MYSYQPYNDPKGKYNFQATNGTVFETEAAALIYCQKFNEYFEAMAPVNDLPWQLDRAEYEAVCTRLNVPSLSDRDCDSYGVRYGDYKPPHNTPAQCVQMALAAKRLNKIEAERKAGSRDTRRPDYPGGKELDCGHIVYWRSQVMNASLGSSCQDCYDRMSN